MDKAQARHKWKKIRRFRPVYFVILFIISAVICLFALRHNSLQMAHLRTQVYAADKSGQGVEQALQNLQLYVTHHMNTNLSGPNGVNPPIQLKYTYRRHQEALIQNHSQSDFYTEAQNYCQRKYPIESSLFVWRSYVSCVQNYLKQHDIHLKVNNTQTPASLYKFDFASPAWSPDLAGWSLVATVVFLLLAVVFGVIDWWVKRRL